MYVWVIKKKKKKSVFLLFYFFFLCFSFPFACTNVCLFFFFFSFFSLSFPFSCGYFQTFHFSLKQIFFFSKLSIRIIKPKRNQLWHKPLFECLFILQGSIRLCISCFSFHNTFVIYINMYLFSFLSLSFPFLCGNFQTFHSNTNFKKRKKRKRKRNSSTNSHLACFHLLLFIFILSLY